jgi:hypothetical protein
MGTLSPHFLFTMKKIFDRIHFLSFHIPFTIIHYVKKITNKF